MARQRVLIADDHPHMLECVSRLLAPEYDVVGAVADGQAAIDAATALEPDVVVLDISMPRLSGLEAAPRLAKCSCTPRIVFLSVHEDPEFIEAARRAGAHGYVLKRRISGDLRRAVGLVLTGQPAFLNQLEDRSDTLNRG